jgi:hypothetical protein
MLRESNPHGYKIPGVASKAVVKLFADDTTAYLSEHDNLTDLYQILENWCLASGAKFNVAKTEIIPLAHQNSGKFLSTQDSCTPETLPSHKGFTSQKRGKQYKFLEVSLGME